MRFLFIIVLLMSSNVFSAEYSGKVKNLYVNSAGGVLVNLDNGNTQLQCAGGVWPLSFNVADIAADHWVSLLITARAQNKTIRVGYNENEDARCTVRYFYYYGFEE